MMKLVEQSFCKRVVKPNSVNTFISITQYLRERPNKSLRRSGMKWPLVSKCLQYFLQYTSPDCHNL